MAEAIEHDFAMMKNRSAKAREYFQLPYYFTGSLDSFCEVS